MSNELNCTTTSTNGMPNIINTTRICYEIEAFVPLPCAEDNNTACITRRMKVTGFKKCTENDMTKTKAVLSNICT